MHCPPRQDDRILKVRCIDQAPARRQLDDLARLSVDLMQIGRVAVVKARRVAELVGFHQPERDIADLGGRSAVAFWRSPGCAADRLETLLHLLTFLIVRQVDDPRVGIAVVSDLVTCRNDAFDDLRALLHDEAGHEERRADVVSPQQLQYSRHSRLPAISALRQQDRALGGCGIARCSHRLAVKIERQQQRKSTARQRHLASSRDDAITRSRSPRGVQYAGSAATIACRSNVAGADMSEDQILAELSVDNIRAHVKHIVETMPSRLAGTPNAARMAAYSEEQIRAAGLSSRIETIPGLVRFPREAELTILSPEEKTLPANTFGHSLETPPEGLAGELVYVGSGHFSDYDRKDVAGKITLSELSYSPGRHEKQRIAGIMGSTAQIMRNWGYPDNTALPLGSVKPAWGNPTPETIKT